MVDTKHLKASVASSAARLQEIDVLFSSGGLSRSAHPKKAIDRVRVSEKQGAPAGKVASGVGKKRSLRPVRKSGRESGTRRSTATTGMEILRVPEWEPYRWLVHGFSTRAGGVST
ncbi:MAG: hypothetical protein ABI076_09480, partial [Acidobacteriaceae bacterium]